MALFSSQAVKDQRQENSIFRGRLIVIVLLVCLFFILVVARVYYLQIVRYDDFLGLAADNHIRLRAITPERGMIYDSQGRLVASNIQSYGLYIHPLKTESIEELLRVCSSLIELDADRMEEVQRKYLAKSRRSELILIKEKLTEKEIARLMVNKYRLAGIEIQPRYQRFYPYGELVSHLVGYIGRISSEEEDEYIEGGYQRFDEIGKQGLESFYEEVLRGTNGMEEVGVNAYGDVVRTYTHERPQRGQDISLWLDIDLQQFIWDSLVEEKGAVVVLDAKTGGILAMVSKPSYDNNLLVQGISKENFANLSSREDAPLFNRATKGRYPPGSTIKPFYSIIALSNEVVTPSYSIFDKGWFSLPNSNQVFRNWKRSGHGTVDLQRALRVSSDTYFYTLATMMGHGMMLEGLDKFSFGRKSSLDVEGESKAVLPTDKWKRDEHYLPWFPGDTVNMGIGQGFLLATPLQLAAATLIFVHSGKEVRPRLVSQIGNETYYDSNEGQYRIQTSESNWALVAKGLEEVVHHEEGTARIAGQRAGYLMAGKTGTSQVVSLARIEELKEQELEIKKEWQDHALFLGYAPANQPRYVISLLLENGGSGVHAALMARSIFDYLLLPRDEISVQH